jgi:hypothetical protein
MHPCPIRRRVPNATEDVLGASLPDMLVLSGVGTKQEIHHYSPGRLGHGTQLSP